MRNRFWVVVASWLLVGGGGRAAAQETPPAAPASEEKPPPEGAPAPAPEPAPLKPWARGVSQAKRSRAEALLGAGNDLFVESRHREALEKYRAALAQWDHPKIRFNIARALINLGRPLQALENIEAALRYGEAGLGTFYQDALTYKRSLENQVATLEVRCSQPGVSVTVDGRSFLRCPGSRSVRVLPGRHQIVGKKAGFLTLTRDLVATAGAPQPVDVRVVTFDDVAVTVRRWDRWKPWAVVGGGALVTGAGILLELQARSTRSDYAKLLADNCSDTPCADDLGRSIFDRARLEHGIAVSAMVLGGAAIVTGVAGVIFNRPRKQLPERDVEPSGPRITPAVGARSAGLSIAGEF